MNKKLDKMKMKQKLITGYAVVIVMMVVLALSSFAGIAFMNGNLNNYINKAQAGDTAANLCQIESNVAARNIREMALNPDPDSYAGYIQKIQTSEEELLNNLQALKGTDVLDSGLYQRYETALTGWIAIGYDIVELIKAGNKDEAASMILGGMRFRIRKCR